MQISFLCILLGTVASVFCDPSSTLFPNIQESSAAPSPSDATNYGFAVSASSAQPSDDDLSTATPDVQPPNIVVIQMEDNRPNETDIQKSVDEAFGDRVVRWLVVAKTTHIDRTEEVSDDFMSGKKKKVSSENRFEQLQVLRDSRHAFHGSEFDLLSVFK